MKETLHNGATLLRLFLVPTPATGEDLPVSEVVEELTAGRAPDNDVVVHDPRASKFHARFVRDVDRYCVIDLGSLNGTWVNGVRIGPGTAVALEDGDVVSLGPVELAARLCRSAEEVSQRQSGEDRRAHSTRLEVPTDLAASLTEFQRDLVAAIAGDEAPDAVTRYADRYLAHPLAVIRRQNHLVREWLALHSGEDISASQLPPELLRDLVRLNARTERLCHPEAADEKGVTPDAYEVVVNAVFILHGDLFPSHLARLDDPGTFSYRELLVSHKYKTDLEDLLLRGRAQGICRHRPIVRGDCGPAAVEMFRTYVDLYSPHQAPEAHAGHMKTLGFYVREGGSCRHRSAGLQLMLQEAGIASRYARGVLMGSGAHAWVEVCQGRPDDFDLVFDPNFGVYGCKSRERATHSEEGMELEMFGVVKATEMRDARAKDLAYLLDRRRFNTIWRPRRRRPAAADEASAGEMQAQTGGD